MGYDLWLVIGCPRSSVCKADPRSHSDDSYQVMVFSYGGDFVVVAVVFVLVLCGGSDGVCEVAALGGVYVVVVLGGFMWWQF